MKSYNKAVQDNSDTPHSPMSTQSTLSTQLLVRKRDGRLVPFNRELIIAALEKAFCAEHNLVGPADLPAAYQLKLGEMTAEVEEQVAGEATSAAGVDVERIQDCVEFELMRHGFYSIARRYILYREEHARQRERLAGDEITVPAAPSELMVNRDGDCELLDPRRLEMQLQHACRGLSEVSIDDLQAELQLQLYNGITPSEIATAMVLAARSRIEIDPQYDRVAARLTLNIIYREALGRTAVNGELDTLYRSAFAKYIEVGIEAGRISERLRSFDLDRLAESLAPERDELFPYLGVQTIYDRYLLHVDGRRIEAPQYFWMRVAMGLALPEGADRTERAIEFYQVLSTFRFTAATPTLFNSGTGHPQLSSCYLSTVEDNLEHIFKVISDNARLSKWAGGLGNDWTQIRATNAHIRGTNGRSQGVIPFLKVVSDTAVAVNQGGKRKGAVCAYLESWHLDIDEFLDLRKNTGDDRRRTHDMHTANWIPDLLMKRVIAGGTWTLFSPDEVPDLHDLVGRAFEERYEHYEREALAGRIRLFREVSAVDLWRKMLTRLFETGHPWMTFKDPSNIRSPQDHQGVVHSSNLCTEILLNTSPSETAVCNLGSINLRSHIRDGQLDLQELKHTVGIAIRMLDNVIDINFYPTDEAKTSNLRHRPIGLGLMGFQDALAACGISYASQEAVEFADRSMEALSYYALLASSQLAKERGTYDTYAGSKWDRGLLPIDTIDLLEQERGMPVDMDRSHTLDWQVVREQIARHGMRNSNVMAIAPTATISTIVGVTQSIEPTYRHIFAKSNLSGEFIQVTINLIHELKDRNLWDDDMLQQLKYHDGTLADIDRLPPDIKARYVTAFDIAPQWLIACASRRQKWIDMGQSFNLYIGEASGRRLNDMYIQAWQMGLKTTYYLRSLSRTKVEQSTVDINRFGVQPKWMKSRSASSSIAMERASAVEPQRDSRVCDASAPDCEACQ